MNQNLRLSFVSDGLPLLLSLLAVAAVLYGCYLFSRFLARRVGKAVNSSNIRILERVALSQDKGLVIAEVCGAVYLIGFSNNSVTILKELDASLFRQTPAVGARQSFTDLLATALKGRMDLKGGDGDERAGKS